MSGPLFTRVLIANRGEIAVRVARTCRALGIETVVPYEERDASGLHRQRADRSVEVGSYLDADALIAAAHEQGCDAVHPGYGFLSENAGFARAVTEAGLTFIGPPPEAMEVMGDKVRARAAMEAAGVPVVPGVTAADPEALASAAVDVGFPLLVKASAGGGGKGMVVVETADELPDAARRASSEALAAFGDGTVYAERLIRRPRHVEVQVFADEVGPISLGERECSIQRRHQKLIEETPSPAVNPELRARFEKAALDAAAAVDYRGAGTVEFLLGEDGELFFLEMNTRLQVEHPVTELVTGLDLVDLQLRVAAGQRIPDELRSPEPRGHAIEARICAEEPALGHLPQAGPLALLRWPEGPGVRVDAGVREGGEASAHYDPMLAKIIAYGSDRDEARRRLAAALRDTVTLGVATNVEHLADVLEHPAFAAGDTTVDFLPEHLPAWPLPQDVPEVVAAASVLPMTSAATTGGSRSGPAIADPWDTVDGFRLGGGS
ncbi:MAG: biotin carboxylase N-terminal domain-containing protein [Acidobacteriota bacterium]